MNNHKLVLVEWEDSSQPISSWRYLSDAPELEVILCASVGWIVDQNERVLMVAPYIGDYKSGGGAQGSGFIRIPSSAVTRIAALEEITC